MVTVKFRRKHDTKWHFATRADLLRAFLLVQQLTAKGWIAFVWGWD